MSKLQAEPDQINLIAKCRELLVQAGIKPAQLEVYDTEAILQKSQTFNTATQRAALNQYWHLQLSPFGELTHAHRFKLIGNGSVVDWIRLFSEGPLDFIIANDLPVRYE